MANINHNVTACKIVTIEELIRAYQESEDRIKEAYDNVVGNVSQVLKKATPEHDLLG